VIWNANFTHLSIVGYPVEGSDPAKPFFQGVTVPEEISPASLTLDHVILGSFSREYYCLSVYSPLPFNVTLSSVEMECLLHVDVGFDSVLDFRNLSVLHRSNVSVGRSSLVSIVDSEFLGVEMSFAARSVGSVARSVLGGHALLSASSDAELYAHSNTFKVGLHAVLQDASAHLSENTFREFDRVIRFNETLVSNLLLELRCSVWFYVDGNYFHNGTFQISDTSSDHGCTFNVQNASKLRWNTFEKPLLEFRVYDLLRNAAEPAITYTKGLHNALTRAHRDGAFMIDATQNWWGDASGPYLCCNDAGVGAYSSLFVNTSDWCLDSLCTLTSNTSLSTSCLMNGCEQKLNTAALTFFILSGALAGLVLLSSILFNIYHNVRHFNTGSFQQYSRSHLLPKAHAQWRIGMTASTIGSLLAIINISIPIASTMRTHAHAHQYIMPFRAFAILWLYGGVSILQTLLNFSGLLASYLKWDHLLRRIVNVSYICNVFNVVCTTIVTLDWIPTAGFVDLLSHYFLTDSSSLINLLYVSSVLVCLISIAAFIPVRLMNQLLYHYDSARISAALEIALLKELMSSPEIEKKARRLRIVTVIAGICGILPTVAAFYDLSIDQYFRIRLIMSVTQHMLGLFSLGAVFAVTFYYNQDILLTLISVVLSTASVGCVQDIIFWAYYLSVAVNSIYSNGYVIFKICASILWLCALLLEHLLMYRLNRDVVTQLPAKAISNLNNHVDQTMDFTDPLRERIPLMITDSESEAPKIYTSGEDEVNAVDLDAH